MSCQTWTSSRLCFCWGGEATWRLYFNIIVQNFQLHQTQANLLLWLIVFALVTPLGTFTSYAIGQNMLLDLSIYFDKIMAVVIGIFLHISTTILFESSENHRFNLIKFVMILLGAGVAIATL